MTRTWARVGAALAAVLLSGLPARAATLATTLADLCPGTPDPCVVGGQFTVPPGTVFDAGGRAVQLLDGAQLVGVGVAPFQLVNAASIDLDPGSLLTTAPQRSPYYRHCSTMDEGFTYAPSEPLSTFVGEDPNGTWRLRMKNYFGEVGDLASWSLEVCTENGCQTVPGPGVPIPPWPAEPETAVTISAVGAVTRVSVLDVTGGGYGLGAIDLRLESPQGTTVYLLSREDTCGGDYDVSFADPISPFFDVRLHSTGACTFGGRVVLDNPGVSIGGTLRAECQSVSVESGALLQSNGIQGGALVLVAGGACTVAGATLRANGSTRVGAGSNHGGEVRLACDGVQLAVAARLEASALPQGGTLIRNGGLIHLDGGAAGVATTARITARGGFYSTGGTVRLAASGPCTVDGAIDLTSKVVVYFDSGEFYSAEGNGGTLEADCGSIVVPARAKVTTSKSPYGRAGRVLLTAASTVHVEEKSYLRADGREALFAVQPPNGVIVRAGDRCTVDGKITVRSSRTNSSGASFQCEGFTLGAKGQVTVSAGGAVAGTLLVDTTGSESGQPPADCVVEGKLRAVSRSIGQYTGNGGAILLRCGTTTTVAPKGRLDVSCPGFEGEAGFIDIESGGDLLVQGRVGGAGSFDGARVDVEACDLEVAAGGEIYSGGFGSSVELVAHDGIDIDGSVRSAVPNGSVSLRYRNSIAVGGNVAPAPTVTQDGALAPCP